jgi:hypothetical protein
MMENYNMRYEQEKNMLGTEEHKNKSKDGV